MIDLYFYNAENELIFERKRTHIGPKNREKTAFTCLRTRNYATPRALGRALRGARENPGRPATCDRVSTPGAASKSKLALESRPGNVLPNLGVTLTPASTESTLSTRYWCHLNNAGVPNHTSFPRRRESTAETFGTERFTYWIPAPPLSRRTASAGMTCGLERRNRANDDCPRPGSGSVGFS